MNDGENDAQTTRPDEPKRITLEGRKFGDVPFASAETRPSEELLRKSVADMADEVAERWDHISGRTTGSRRGSV